MSRPTTQRATKVNVAELRRAKYLNLKTIGGSGYSVTDWMLRAPFPQGSAGLRAAAERALAAELEASLELPR